MPRYTPLIILMLALVIIAGGFQLASAQTATPPPPDYYLYPFSCENTFQKSDLVYASDNWYYDIVACPLPSFITRASRNDTFYGFAASVSSGGNGYVYIGDSSASRSSNANRWRGSFPSSPCLTYGGQNSQDACNAVIPSHSPDLNDSSSDDGSSLDYVYIERRASCSDDGAGGLSCGNYEPFFGTSVNISGLVMYGNPPLEADFDATPTIGNAPLEVTVTDNSTPQDQIDTWEWDFGDGSPAVTGQNPGTHTYTEQGTYTITLTINNSGGQSGTHTEEITVIESDIVRPFLPEDETSIATIDTGDRSLLRWWKDDIVASTASSYERQGEPVPVHAAMSGRVVNIETMSTNMCHDNDNGGGGFCTIDFDGDDYVIRAGQIDAARVVTVENHPVESGVQPDPLYLQYIVVDPTVQLDNQIVAGCPIGYAVQVGYGGNDVLTLIRGLNSSLDNTTNASQNAASEPILNRMLLHADPDSELCDSQDHINTGCLNTGSKFGLNNRQHWQLNNATMRPGDDNGVTLQPGGRVSQTIDLPEQQYQLQVTTAGRGSFEVRFGDETHQLESEVDSFFQMHRILTDPASVQPLTQFVIIADADNTNDLVIQRACVAPDFIEEGPSSACYFGNHNFESFMLGWAYTNPIGVIERGTLQMGHDATLYQNVRLFPGDYKIRAHFGEFIGDTPTSPRLDYSYGGGSGYFDIPDVDASQYGSGANVAVKDFSITEETSAPFTFTADLGSGYEGRAQVQRLCIETVDGGDLPGYEDEPGYIPIKEDIASARVCENVTRPSNPLSIGGWISWLWGKMTNVFDCMIMPAFEWVIDGVFSVLDVIVSFGKWAATIAGMFVGLFVNLTDVIGALIRNLVLRILDDFNWFKTALLMGWDLVKSFWTRIIPIFGMIGDVITAFWTNFGLVRQAWLDAAPYLIEGVPACDIQPKEHPVCTATWVLDNTLFADYHPGDVALRIIVSTMVMHLIIWLIGEYKRTFMQGSSSL